MRRVCVFCGSSHGIRPAYAEAARALGQVLVARGLGLVYGGGNVGLMGVVADAVLAAGGEVIGVIPHALMAREIGHAGVTTMHVVDSMHERKALMAELADAFVALPGGLGTLEELFEVWTASTLGMHRKPVVVLDPWGDLAPLRAAVDALVATGFVRPGAAAHVTWTTTVDGALDAIGRAWDAPAPASVARTDELLEFEP